MKFLQRHTQSQQQNHRGNDVGTNIYLGGFGADSEYAFAEISLTTPRNLFLCKGLKQRKDTSGIDLLKVNSQLNKHFVVTSLKLESLCR